MKVYVCLKETPIEKVQNQMYRDLLAHPAVEYVEPDMSIYSKYSFRLGYTRRVLMKHTNIKRVPLASGTADLIHSIQYPLTNKTPWVMDTEHPTGMLHWFNYSMFSQPKWTSKVEKIINSPHCKKIMPMTDAARESTLAAFKLNDPGKLRTIYPAVHPQPPAQKKEGSSINLLFVGRLFSQKGAEELLEAHDQLKKKFDVKLTMVTEAPDDVRKKYANDPTVELPGSEYGEKLNNRFREADVFVMPTYVDTFGSVYIEAYSHGIPAVGTDQYGQAEIIRDGKTGYHVHSPIHLHMPGGSLKRWSSWEHFQEELKKVDKTMVTKGLVEKLTNLIEDGRLRRSMGANAFAEVESGRFSITTRNKAIREVYEEAMHS